MVCTIYQQLSPAEVRGQLERVVEQLLEPFPQVAEQLAEQHDEWAEARRKGKSGGTEFAQPLLREPPTLWLRMIEHGVRIFYDVSTRWRGAVLGYDIREAEY